MSDGSYIDWRDRAACLGENTELFFPVGSGAVGQQQSAAAKQICRRCPVLERCAEVAIVNGYEGVWGGLDDDERRLLRRARYGSVSPRDIPVARNSPIVEDLKI